MRNFSFIGTDEPVSQRKCAIRAWVPYVAGLVCYSVFNCTNGSALNEKLRTHGYLDAKTLATVGRAGSEIGTLSYVVACALMPWMGPRIMGSTGAAMNLIASFLMTRLSKPTNETMLYSIVALQIVGGSFVCISCMSFTNLMPKRRALLDGISGSAVAASSTLCLPLFNDPSVSLQVWYTVLAGVSFVTVILAIVFFPDQPYDAGDEPTISMPSLKGTRSTAKSQFAYLRAFRDLRFIGFVATYVWTAVLSDWYSTTSYGIRAGSAPRGYFRWGVPMFGGCSSIFMGPIVGLIIDRSYAYGAYAVTGVLQLSGSAILVLSLLSSQPAVLWVSLPGIAFLSNLIYLSEISYLQRCYPIEALPCLMMVVELCHSVVGLLNYPVLARNPWGANYLPPILLFALPLIPMFIWPVLECKWAGKPLHAGRGWQDSKDSAATVSPSSESLQDPMYEADANDGWPEAVVVAAV